MENWFGHIGIFLLSGFSYWLMRGGQHGVATALAIGLLVGGVYFISWWALLTFLVGLFVGARVFQSAEAQTAAPARD